MIGVFNNSERVVVEEQSLVNNVEYEVKDEIKNKANVKKIDMETCEKANVIDVDPGEVKKAKVEKKTMEGPNF